MLRVCAGVDQHTRFCAVLTAFAESDFRADAVNGATVGVFQQNPKWWPSATHGTEAQCRAFIADFQRNENRHTGDPVHDCWVTQRWAVPNGGVSWPDPGPGFIDAPSTRNYTRRVSLIDRIITEGKLP